MRTILTAVALTVAVPAWAANTTPSNVNVTNTPLPVTVTNATTNQNVTVTNSASNPLKTAEAFSRQPVRLFANGTNVTADLNYVVPAGFRLIVETVSASASCVAPGALAMGALSIFANSNPTWLLFQRETGQMLAATQSFRMLLEPGEKLTSFFGCDPGNASDSFGVQAFGYLVSVNSPSLAP